MDSLFENVITIYNTTYFFTCQKKYKSVVFSFFLFLISYKKSRDQYPGFHYDLKSDHGIAAGEVLHTQELLPYSIDSENEHVLSSVNEDSGPYSA